MYVCMYVCITVGHVCMEIFSIQQMSVTIYFTCMHACMNVCMYTFEETAK